jgi:hypothetical protein
MKILIFILLALPLTAFSSGGDRVGNGAHAAVCGNNVRLFDVFDAEEHQGIKLDFGPDDLTAEQKVVHILERARKFQPKRVEMYLKWFSTFFKESNQAIKLPIIPDAGVADFSEGCRDEQLYIQLPDIAIDEDYKRYTQATFYFNQLDKNNQAATWIHELVYREAIMAGQNDSMKVRRMVVALLKNEQSIDNYLPANFKFNGLFIEFEDLFLNDVYKRQAENIQFKLIKNENLTWALEVVNNNSDKNFIIGNTNAPDSEFLKNCAYNINSRYNGKLTINFPEKKLSKDSTGTMERFCKKLQYHDYAIESPSFGIQFINIPSYKYSHKYTATKILPNTPFTVNINEKKYSAQSKHDVTLDDDDMVANIAGGALKSENDRLDGSFLFDLKNGLLNYYCDFELDKAREVELYGQKLLIKQAIWNYHLSHSCSINSNSYRKNGHVAIKNDRYTKNEIALQLSRDQILNVHFETSEFELDFKEGNVTRIYSTEKSINSDPFNYVLPNGKNVNIKFVNQSSIPDNYEQFYPTSLEDQYVGRFLFIKRFLKKNKTYQFSKYGIYDSNGNDIVTF